MLTLPHKVSSTVFPLPSPKQQGANKVVLITSRWWVLSFACLKGECRNVLALLEIKKLAFITIFIRSSFILCILCQKKFLKDLFNVTLYPANINEGSQWSQFFIKKSPPKCKTPFAPVWPAPLNWSHISCCATKWCLPLKKLNTC